jgi:hypothetical protein
VSNITLEDLIANDKPLADVEKILRIDGRQNVLKLAPKNGVGAELGVFTGKFSEIIYDITKPSKMYLVDAWHTLYGEKFPNWGAYTANGELSTETALKAVRLRAEKMGGVGEIVISTTTNWLAKMPAHSLDWAYIDSSHAYRHTYDEIEALLCVLKPSGVILGDDCYIDPLHRHHGVFRAIRDHAVRGALEIIWMDGAGQWAMRRRTS